MPEPTREELSDALAHIIAHLDEPFPEACVMRALNGPCLKHARRLLTAMPPDPDQGKRWDACLGFGYGADFNFRATVEPEGAEDA